MARKRLLRGVLAGQTAALALAVACGAMLPLGVDRDGQGMWSLHLNVALADRGRGGGSDGGGDDHGGGSGGGSDGGGSSGSGSGGGGSGGSGSGGSGSGGGGSGGSSSGGGGSSGSGSGGSGSGGGSSGGCGGHGGGSGSSGGGGDDHGSSSSGSGGSDDGAAHDSGDDNGSSRRRGSDARVSGRSAGSDDRSRPRATVEMSDSDVAAVMRGERVLVDDKGRVLEVEVEVEHGVRTVTVKPHGGDARRNPGPIANVRTVDTSSPHARSVVAHPVAGGFELEVEHGVVVQKPHGGAAATAAPGGRGRDPVQVGDDLSREQEADLIRGGWQ